MFSDNLVSDLRFAVRTPQFNISRVSRPKFESVRDETDVFESVTSFIFTGASLATPLGTGVIPATCTLREESSMTTRT